MGDYLPPHKYIKNSSEYETHPISQLLNDSRRPHTSIKGNQSIAVTKKKKKKKINPERKTTQ